MRDCTIVAVGIAIIDKDNKVLIAKRLPDKPMPDKWEFPGGKLEVGESLQECGKREIKEELELDITIDNYIGFENIKYDQKDFCLHLYTAHLSDENQNLKLNVHSQVQWVDLEEFENYDFPAKTLPFIEDLKKAVRQR